MDALQGLSFHFSLLVDFIFFKILNFNTCYFNFGSRPFVAIVTVWRKTRGQ